MTSFVCSDTCIIYAIYIILYIHIYIYVLYNIYNIYMCYIYVNMFKALKKVGLKRNYFHEYDTLRQNSR